MHSPIYKEVKYLLHSSHDSLGHTGATKLYHFLKRLHYFLGMRKKIHLYGRSCQIMNLEKPYSSNLHQEIVQTPQDHIFIDLLRPYNVMSQGNSDALTTVCNLIENLMTTPI